MHQVIKQLNNHFFYNLTIQQHSKIEYCIKLFILNLPPQNMKSNKQISSTKSLKRASLQMIQTRCKNDHFSYNKYLSLKKNQSSYTSEYKQMTTKERLKNQQIEDIKNKMAPPFLDINLVKRSLHQSSVHYSPKKVAPLPILKIGSTYKQNYECRSQEKIVKGRQRSGFFLKMPWHDNPLSNYTKSYQRHNSELNQHEQEKIVNDHLQVHKMKFKGKSNYQLNYSELMSNQLSDSKNCIKNKDHIAGSSYPLKGQSQYTSKYDKTQDKENLISSKSITSGKKLNLLPDIRNYKIKIPSQKIPKKSVKTIKKSIKNEIKPEQMKQMSSHQRIFGIIDPN